MIKEFFGYMLTNYMPNNRIRFEPPSDIDIRDFLPKEDPLYTQPLEFIGLETILNGVSFSWTNHSIVLRPSLENLLTYNQAYMVVCNCLWVLNNFVGEIIHNQDEMEYRVKSSFINVIKDLICLEGKVGDFGQEVDFRQLITLNDFGLSEYDC